ncbi:MAG TPA: hypothetical protein VKR31_16470 [Rhizomicrobium sp.]|nr:hypothetical protein [Rhizomicrobium sp.]
MTKTPNGKCTICAQPERYRIEMALAGGAGLRPVARKFGVSYHALWRHWTGHVDDTRKAALIAGPMRLSELADRAADEGGSLIDHFIILRNTLYRRLDACDAAGDANQVSSLSARIVEVLREMGKLTGQLAKSGISITQNNLFISPQWAEVQAVLVQVLAHHPAARADVFRAFREIEHRASAAPVIEGRCERRDDASRIAA